MDGATMTFQIAPKYFTRPFARNGKIGASSGQNLPRFYSSLFVENALNAFSSESSNFSLLQPPSSLCLDSLSVGLMA
jgi:hypothetical protein